jgi:hypothetical protein
MMLKRKTGTVPYRGSWQRRLNAVQKSYKVFIFSGLILS